MTPLLPALFSLFLLLSLSGCSWLPFRSPDPLKADLSVETLKSRGEAEFNQKNYTRAIGYFQKLKDEFPFAPQAMEVELKLGEAYYRNKQYPEATASFRDFLALHPTHASVPFALYHLGLIYFDQFNGTERDQKNTGIAKGYFESVARDYPNSSYAGQAKEKLAQSLGYLADHELTIAAFYQREGKYPAARDRLETVLRNYRETPAAAKALYQLGEIYRQEQNSAKATLAYEALIQHYPKSDLSKEAQIRLGQLEKNRQDPLETLLARDKGVVSPPPGASTPIAAAPKETALVAKKGVVHEEPGDGKGVFLRVAETLNPVGWFSSGEEKKEKTDVVKTAKKDGSGGFFSSFWSNPSTRKPKEAVKTDPELISKVDKTLERAGLAPEKTPKIQPPVVSLPKLDEPQKRTVDPALLGAIDARLKSQGKDGAELPQAPEGLALPVAVTPRQDVKSTTSGPTAGLLGSIDQALKQKGIESPKAESENARLGTKQTSTAVKQEKPIELQPKLTAEKGPLFLETGEYQIQEKPTEAKEANQGQDLKVPAPAQEIPKTIVQGPSQSAKEKALEIKPAGKKNTDGEEEPTKGIFDRLREDMESMGRVLNPFKW